MKAIILAAGMGTRLGKYTKNLPKGMLEFMGKTLIERQVETLQKCEINDIIIVTGYVGDKIQIPNVKYYKNDDFANTNMVETLFKAEQEINGEILVLYSDIIYEERILKTVLKSKVDIGVTVDYDYWEYWTARLQKPEEDIESLVIDENGYIVELGDTACIREKSKIRYVGIIKFSARGSKILKSVYNKNKDKYYDKNERWMRSKCFKKAYMTCMLQALINEGYKVSPIFISHGWMEFDTVTDYELANKWHKEGTLGRFIKIK